MFTAVMAFDPVPSHAYKPMVLVSSKPMVLVGYIAVVMPFLHAGRERETRPGTEEPMTTVDFR